MGRLIDADNIKGCAKYIKTNENFEPYIMIVDLAKLLDEQPTAYSVGKAVEELGKIEQHCLDVSDWQGQRAICDAIEIVKQGGVSDDVCEWEKGSIGYVGYPAYYSKCCTTDSKGLEMQTHIISDWKFCPYCGKKIKVVGD